MKLCVMLFLLLYIVKIVRSNERNDSATPTQPNEDRRVDSAYSSSTVSRSALDPDQPRLETTV